MPFLLPGDDRGDCLDARGYPTFRRQSEKALQSYAVVGIRQSRPGPTEKVHYGFHHQVIVVLLVIWIWRKFGPSHAFREWRYNEFPQFPALPAAQVATSRPTARQTFEMEGEGDFADYAVRQPAASSQEDPVVVTVNPGQAVKPKTAAPIRAAAASRPMQPFCPDDASLVAEAAAASGEASVEIDPQGSATAAAPDVRRDGKESRADFDKSQLPLRSDNLGFFNGTSLHFQEQRVDGQLCTAVYSLPRKATVYEGGLGEPMAVVDGPIDVAMDQYFQLTIDPPSDNAVESQVGEEKEEGVKLRPQQQHSMRQSLRRWAFKMAATV